MSGKKQGLDEFYAGASKTLIAKAGGQSESTESITAPKVWKSSPGHPAAFLVYITAKEAAHLAKKDMHNSGVDREMHFGPGGIPSYQGDGDSGGGDSGGDSGGTDAGSDSTSDGTAGAASAGGAAGSASNSGAGAASAADAASSTSDSNSSSPDASSPASSPSESGEPESNLFADQMVVTTLAPAEDRSPRQFETRKQTANRRASGAGATRSDNTADLLGYVAPQRSRAAAARRKLGSR